MAIIIKLICVNCTTGQVIFDWKKRLFILFVTQSNWFNAVYFLLSKTVHKSHTYCIFDPNAVMLMNFNSVKCEFWFIQMFWFSPLNFLSFVVGAVAVVGDVAVGARGNIPVNPLISLFHHHCSNVFSMSSFWSRRKCG